MILALRRWRQEDHEFQKTFTPNIIWVPVFFPILMSLHGIKIAALIHVEQLRSHDPFPSFFFLFHGTGSPPPAKGLILVRKPLYHLSHTCRLFVLVLFLDKVLCFLFNPASHSGSLYLYLLSSWDYTCVPPCPAQKVMILDFSTIIGRKISIAMNHHPK
jgi:hypothetical protein